VDTFDHRRASHRTGGETAEPDLKTGLEAVDNW